MPHCVLSAHDKPHYNNHTRLKQINVWHTNTQYQSTFSTLKKKGHKRDKQLSIKKKKIPSQMQ